MADVHTVFTDTNVLFSAIYGSINAEKIVSAHSYEKINLIISLKIVEELERNIRKKEPGSLVLLEHFLLNHPPKIVLNPKFIFDDVAELVDPKDQVIFQAALDSQAEIFVTGNIKHFSIPQLEKRFQIKILSPPRAVRELGL